MTTQSQPVTDRPYNARGHVVRASESGGVSTKLDPHESVAFEAICAKENISKSAKMRALIRECIAKHKGAPR